MNSAPQLRTLLILGRVSNLPTVWSNCLAGWWLGGGGNFWKLPFLFLGVSLLDTGGISPFCPPRSAGRNLTPAPSSGEPELVPMAVVAGFFERIQVTQPRLRPKLAGALAPALARATA